MFCFSYTFEEKNLLFEDLLPLGGREGLQLEAGLVDEYDRQVEVRVPHLEEKKKKLRWVQIQGFFARDEKTTIDIYRGI